MTPLSGATLEVGSGASAAFSNIAAGITVKICGGTLTLSGSTSSATISAGALVETVSGGTVFVSGAMANSGTLIASGSASLVEITSGAVVRGGRVEVGNGTVDVLSGGSANVAFLATGSGGVDIADTNGNSSAFIGTISGFGGVNHSNHKQFIDLVGVISAAHTISLSYVSAASHTSGTLFVSSGGAVVAQINMIGNYTSKNFSAKADSSGNVEIVDPATPNGGSVVPTPARILAQQGIDLPNIAFGAHKTLAYAKDAADARGTLTASGGRHAAASPSSATTWPAASPPRPTAGGTLVTPPQDAEQQRPRLTHPQA